MAASDSNGTHELIDQIVREVLARLAGTQKTETKQPKSGELALAAKVITLAELDGKIDGVRQLVLPRGAIVTPAVRDLMRQKQIAVTYRSGEKLAGERPRMAIGVEAKYEVTALVRTLEAHAGGIERLETKDLAGGVKELASRVASGKQLGLLLTHRAAAAACLANRRSGVRAAVATDSTSAAAAVATLGVNLLVVDPANKSLYELIRIGREYLRGGLRACPAELVESLS